MDDDVMGLSTINIRDLIENLLEPIQSGTWFAPPG